MKLDTIRVQPVMDLSAASLHRHVTGMSVLLPEEHEAGFEIGKSYSLSQGKERYRVLVLEKHPTSLGVCCFLKLWEPN